MEGERKRKESTGDLRRGTRAEETGLEHVSLEGFGVVLEVCFV